jgi:hypothetical protein
MKDDHWQKENEDDRARITPTDRRPPPNGSRPNAKEIL